jgi:hypothetical protein
MNSIRTDQSRTLWRCWKFLAILVVVIVRIQVGQPTFAFEPLPVVSPIALIANPEKYNGKKIVVTGFVSLGFERNRLFLSPYDAGEFNDNSLFLDLAGVDESLETRWMKELDQKTVDIEGTFYLPKNAAYWSGYPNGIIGKITKMQLHVAYPSKE